MWADGYDCAGSCARLGKKGKEIIAEDTILLVEYGIVYESFYLMDTRRGLLQRSFSGSPVMWDYWVKGKGKGFHKISHCPSWS